MSALPAGATAVLATLLEARTGQQLAANRVWRIDTALRPLIAAEGLETAEQLAARVLAAGDAGLADRIVDALLNQETSFFRDMGVLEAAAAAAATLAAEHGRRPRLWSAGCSTGQEPLSLAMHFAEGDAAAMPEIVATDVSAAAIARGRAGRFSQFEIQRGLPVRRMMRWFDSDGGDWLARPELTGAVTWRRHNLVVDAPPAGRFDQILCRNVLLYLSPERRATLFESFADALHPGGLLVLGAGETVIGQTGRFRPSARFRGLYERVEGAARPASRAA